MSHKNIPLNFSLFIVVEIVTQIGDLHLTYLVLGVAEH